MPGFEVARDALRNLLLMTGQEKAGIPDFMNCDEWWTGGSHWLHHTPDHYRFMIRQLDRWYPGVEIIGTENGVSENQAGSKTENSTIGGENGKWSSILAKLLAPLMRIRQSLQDFPSGVWWTISNGAVVILKHSVSTGKFQRRKPNQNTQGFGQCFKRITERIKSARIMLSATGMILKWSKIHSIIQNLTSSIEHLNGLLGAWSGQGWDIYVKVVLRT